MIPADIAVKRTDQPTIAAQEASTVRQRRPSSAGSRSRPVQTAVEVAVEVAEAGGRAPEEGPGSRPARSRAREVATPRHGGADAGPGCARRRCRPPCSTTKPTRTGSSVQAGRQGRRAREPRACGPTAVDHAARPAGSPRSGASCSPWQAHESRPSGSEPGAALAPASGEDGAARARAHPQPEAMRLAATTVVRLERALAHGDKLPWLTGGSHCNRHSARRRRPTAPPSTAPPIHRGQAAHRRRGNVDMRLRSTPQSTRQRYAVGSREGQTRASGACARRGPSAARHAAATRRATIFLTPSLWRTA